MRPSTYSISEIDHGIRATIHTVPNAKESKIVLEQDGTVVMRVQAPPVRDKANREIVRWLSKTLRRPRSQIRIVAGAHSRTKTLEIIGIDRRDFLKAVGYGLVNTDQPTARKDATSLSAT